MTWLKVIKSERRLELYRGGELLAAFPIALGFAPIGHKQREGDGRTPEGKYYVCTRNAASDYHRALGLSYPNEADADVAFLDGRISLDQHALIREAIRQNRRPPWDTPLGGFVMLHGGGIGCDWTAGCIALENDAMDVLWEVCEMGTEVEIVP